MQTSAHDGIHPLGKLVMQLEFNEQLRTLRMTNIDRSEDGRICKEVDEAISTY